MPTTAPYSNVRPRQSRTNAGTERRGCRIRYAVPRFLVRPIGAQIGATNGPVRRAAAFVGMREAGQEARAYRVLWLSATPLRMPEIGCQDSRHRAWARRPAPKCHAHRMMHDLACWRRAQPAAG